MVKRCIYCKLEIEESSVVDVCQRCGIGVWGERMFKAIIQNMEKARNVGDLNQGFVSFSSGNIQTKKTSSPPSVSDDAIANTENSKKLGN